MGEFILTQHSKIVGVRSSNSGYHPKWIYFYGPDLKFIRPCREVTKSTLDNLNNLEKYGVEYLDSFQGSRLVYTYLDMKDNRFSEGHQRKVFSEPLYLSLLVCVSDFIILA